MRQNFLRFFMLISFTCISVILFAQSGVVYSFSFRIAPELTQYEKIEYKRNWFSGFSEGEAMPESLIDSIKLKTEEAFSAKLKMPVKMCFYQHKSDVHFSSFGPDALEGLPEPMTLKKAKSVCPQNTRYIVLSVNIYSGGSFSVTSANKKTKIKPRIDFIAWVVDEDNNEVWKNKVELKDFSKLRSVTKYYEGYEVTKSETLSPLDIYAMYLMALEKITTE